jgi:hypothetical protein
MSPGQHRDQDFIERAVLSDDPPPDFSTQPDCRRDERLTISWLVR